MVRLLGICRSLIKCPSQVIGSLANDGEIVTRSLIHRHFSDNMPYQVIGSLEGDVGKVTRSLIFYRFINRVSLPSDRFTDRQETSVAKWSDYSATAVSLIKRHSQVIGSLANDGGIVTRSLIHHRFINHTSISSDRITGKFPNSDPITLLLSFLWSSIFSSDRFTGKLY